MTSCRRACRAGVSKVLWAPFPRAGSPAPSRIECPRRDCPARASRTPEQSDCQLPLRDAVTHQIHSKASRKAALTTSRDVDLAPPKPPSSPPSLRLFPRLLPTQVPRTRRRADPTDVRHRPTRADRAHSLPPLLPACIRQRQAHEVVLCPPSNRLPPLRRFSGRRLRRTRIKRVRDEAAKRRSSCGKGWAVA